MNSAYLLCVLAAVAWTSIGSGIALSLPSYIKLCSRNDPKLNECAVRNGQSVIPRIVQGVPELNIPILDPLVISREVPIQGDFAMKLRDVKLYGMKKAILRDVNFDFGKKVLSYSIRVPKCVVLGNYIGNGSIDALNVEVNGKGKFNLTLGNLDFNLSLPYDLVAKNDGKQYMSIKDNTEFNLDAAEAYIYMENIAKDDAELSQLINDFLNDNWRSFMPDVVPALGKVTNEEINEALGFLKKVPFEDFFTKE